MTSHSLPSNSDIKNRFSVEGYVDSSLIHITYKDSTLSWGSEQVKVEDIVAVIETGGSGTDQNAHTIFSLAPSTTPLSVKLRTTNASILPASFSDEFPSRKLPEYLQAEPDVGNVLHVLISTRSGTGLALDFWDHILHPLLDQVGWKDARYNIVRTSSAESVKEFARDVLLVGAEKGTKQSVLLLSGDGGVVDTINALSGYTQESRNYTKPTIIQIPLGTGNALFHSLHKASKIPSLYVQSLRTLFSGLPKPLPSFKATFSPGARLLTNEGQTTTPLQHNALYGAVVASYGLHATLVADSDTTEYRKHGDKRFALVAKDLLYPDEGVPHAYQAGVTLDGKDMLRSEHGYVLATLVSNLEKTFTISPDSKPLDGKLRVVHFGPMGGNEAMEIMKAAYDDGKHVSLDEVGYDVVNDIKIQFQEGGDSWKWRRCCIDGLIVGVEQGGWMQVELTKDGEEAVMIVVDDN